MPIYKLEPIAGPEGHTDWWASTVPPTPVWLQAKVSDHARQRIRLAPTIFASDKDDVSAPWTIQALAKAEEAIQRKKRNVRSCSEALRSEGRHAGQFPDCRFSTQY